MKPKNSRFLTPLIHFRCPSPALGLAVAVSSLAVQSAHADATWNGVTSQDWNTGTNWSTNPPTGAFFINTATGNYPVRSAASTFTPVDLIIGNGAGQSGRLDQSTGTLSLANTGTNGNWMQVARGGGTGVYNLTGDGSLAVGKLWVGGFVYGENGTGTVTIDTSGTVTANSTDDFTNWGQYQTSLSVGWGPTGNGTLNLVNGTINVPNRAIYVGSWGATGALNQSGGTINAKGLHLGRWFSNATTPSSVNVSGGTLNTAWISLAGAGNANDVTKGIVNLSGSGIVNSEGDVIVAQGGAAASYGEINIGTGATLNVATTTERWMIVNMYDAAQGRVTVNGGTLNLNANTDLRFSVNGNTGASSVTLNDGAINGGAGSVLAFNNANAAAANNTVNLNGGTLRIGGIVSGGANGTRAFNFNGGTLKAAASSATFFASGVASAANVQSGGAVIDSNGFNVTIGQALGGTGALTKNGTGTLTLSGANTYTGATTVNAGQLILGGAPATSGLTVAANANLNVEEPLFTLGSLTVPTASFDAGASLTLETNTGGTSEKMVVSTAGGLSFSTLGVNLNIEDTANGAFGGTYTLLEYTGSFTGDIANLTVLNPRAGYTYNFADTGSSITVEVVAGDTDGDGMDDFYEQNHGLDYLVDDASGNLDSDFATNIEEFIAGTDPQSAGSDPFDTDLDSLRDHWEDQYFGNNNGTVEPGDLTPQNGSGDPDGDLVTNLVEFTNLTLPNDASSWPDTDGDTINDGWETTFFGSLATDGSADTDGDGFTDAAEYAAHTNPSAATGSDLSPIWSTLANRWSFTGNLTDSVGSSDATIIEVGANDVVQNANSVTITGGNKAASDYVKLGSNLLPKSATPVTIELWAKQESIKNWGRIFDFHSNTGEYLMMTWTMNTNNATDRLEFKDNGTSLYVDNANQPYGTVEEQHIVVTLEPLVGTGGKTRVSVYSAPSGAADLGAAQAVSETTVNLVNFQDAIDALGYSPWPDDTANATYNEVRIWNGALFGWMREKLHDQGADNAAIPDADNDQLPDDWEIQYFTDTATGTSLTEDSDADSFTNLVEYNAGSNPNSNLSTPSDLDADELADEWEIQHFGNVAAQNGSGDPDSDGLTNEQEETSASNPNDDEDGLAAGWEIFFFGSTTTQTGTDDSDGDGVSNVAEYLVSQPNNSASTPTDVNGDGIADAAQHTLALADAQGTSSFNAGQNWNDALAPAAGEAYIVPITTLRTPAGVGDFTFAGARLDLLEVYTGKPALVVKNDGVTTIPFVTLNGSYINHASTNGFVNTLAGNIDIRGPFASDILANNGGFIVNAVISGSSQLNLIGGNTVTLAGANTHTGNIHSTGGGLILSSTGSLKFVPGASGVTNAITGTSAVTLNGALNIDTTAASTAPGSTWDLITSTGAVTIGANFTVTGFTADAGAVGARIWTSGSYQYAEATGVLGVSAADPDTDSDGYTDSVEIAAGSDPNAATSIPGDIDGDGLSDAWETSSFGNLAQTDSGDTDADGSTNHTEYRLGLDPNSGSSRFSATLSANAITWQGKAGVTFEVQSSTDLNTWSTISTQAGVDGTNTFEVTPSGFYRVLLQP